MIVVLKPGETLHVQFYESDGEITVDFSETAITVNADLPDTSGREGEIYREEFGKFIFDLETNDPEFYVNYTLYHLTGVLPIQVGPYPNFQSAALNAAVIREFSSVRDIFTSGSRDHSRFLLNELVL
jgi:hypothetical protein